MTKINRSETAKALQYAALGHFDIAARTMSAAVRSARGMKERNEIIASAAEYPAIIQHPEFLI